MDYARKNGFSGTDIVTACKELTGRGVRKISPDQVKAMLHGSVQGETEETMEPPVLPAQQENIITMPESEYGQIKLDLDTVNKKKDFAPVKFNNASRLIKQQNKGFALFSLCVILYFLCN